MWTAYLKCHDVSLRKAVRDDNLSVISPRARISDDLWMKLFRGKLKHLMSLDPLLRKWGLAGAKPVPEFSAALKWIKFWAVLFSSSLEMPPIRIKQRLNLSSSLWEVLTYATSMRWFRTLFASWLPQVLMPSTSRAPTNILQQGPRTIPVILLGSDLFNWEVPQETPRVLPIRD